MSAVKKTISIPDELFNEADQLSDNFSSLVCQALEAYINHVKIEYAVQSFGQWQERETSSIDIVNQLRKDEGRNYERNFD